MQDPPHHWAFNGAQALKRVEATSSNPYCERSEKGKSLLCLVFFFPFPLRQSAHNRWGQVVHLGPGMDGGCDEVLVNVAHYFVPVLARTSILKLHRGLILSTALHPTSHN